MPDKISKETRSKIMAAIKGRNTKPEMIVRQGLFRRGYRYKLYSNSLAGKPDLVFPKYGAVIFINGCFWHGHKCSLFQEPQTNQLYWKTKISANKKRDAKAIKALLCDEWRVLVLWECALYRKQSAEIEIVLDEIEKWLHSSNVKLSIDGFK